MLSKYGFDGDDIPFHMGSALQALEACKAKPGIKKGEDPWVDKVLDLMETVDSYIQLPERATDKPFLLAVDLSCELALQRLLGIIESYAKPKA